KYLEMGLSYADTQWTFPANATPEEKAGADKGLSWQSRLWIDDMFMITILQSQAYNTTWKREYMYRSVKEMVVYLYELQRHNGLFYHAPDVP
ncbi:glycosyl hydrolase, partial [Parabacteroides merdae]|nr:glycosyl hydrolase [Parabacteroides merdae]